MKKMILAAGLLLSVFSAHAGNGNNNDGCQGNCSGGGSDVTANGGDGGNGYGGDGGNATGAGLGVGVGIGVGGSSVATGGEGGKGGAGGNGVGFGGDGGSVVGSGNSANLNSNVAKGGSAEQSQAAISGSKSIAQMASENSLNNKVNASSANDNRSSAAGNTTVTNVGGDSTLVERNAPPVFLGNLTATMSCAGGFNAGASDRNGSGAFGFTWISSDCRSVVIGREFVGIGMPDVACRIWKTTKGYKRAVKADPSLANVDCAVKPAAVIVPAPAVTFPETSRKSRG